MSIRKNQSIESVIDRELTPIERHILANYRSPSAADVPRQVRLSGQYAIGTAIFVYLDYAMEQPMFSVAVWATFVLWMLMRLRGASRIAGIMPGIIEKYEATIIALQAELERTRSR